MRFCRTRAYGLVRALFNELGKKLSKKNLIENQRDIFYLTLDEVFKLVKGPVAETGIKILIQKRKKEFKLYSKIKSMPPRFSTNGYVSEYKVEDENPQKKVFSTLKGIGCSPGMVTGKIKVLFDPNGAKINNQILCTRQMDPGWVLLFPMCKGILSERGSVLSHSAIVAREMGIPTILGINNLTNSLKDNKKVRMDGTKGIVHVL